MTTTTLLHNEWEELMPCYTDPNIRNKVHVLGLDKDDMLLQDIVSTLAPLYKKDLTKFKIDLLNHKFDDENLKFCFLNDLTELINKGFNMYNVFGYMASEEENTI